MTFIDEALKNCHSGEEFVQAMASVYEYPEVRNNLKDYPEWIRNIIAIVDYLIQNGLTLTVFRA